MVKTIAKRPAHNAKALIAQAHRKRDLLICLAVCNTKNLSAPSYNELATLMGYSSRAPICGLVNALIDEGYLTRDPAKAHRNLVMVASKGVYPVPTVAQARLQVTPTVGGKKPGAKPTLPDSDVSDMRQRYTAGGVTMQALADEYHVSLSTVSLIISGKRRK